MTLQSDSLAPIEASPTELDPIDNLPAEGVEHDHDPDAIKPDDETIITEPEVMHPDESDLFVPVEAPANPVITPHLSWAMKKLEIDGVAPPILEACTWSGKVLSTMANLLDDQDGLQQALIGVVMTQYHVQKGLRVFGEVGVDGVRKELQQLHDHKIPKPVHPEGLSKEQFTIVLEYLMFLKEKRSGVIKGCGCADGCPQRLYTGKVESASPTVLMESVLLTAVIEAQEHCMVYTADIPGAIMQGDQEEVIHMVLCSPLAMMLIERDPDLYAPYCCLEKGQPVSYDQLMKGLYRCLQATIQFWKKLTHQLVQWGSVINPL